MDSFGTLRKWKLIYIFFFVNAEFYRVVWTINALLTVCSEMLPFSGNNQNIKMFGVPRNILPWVMYIMIICHWTILHYNMPFQTIAGRSDGVFWWFPALSEDQERNLSNSPKLSCGFNKIIELLSIYLSVCLSIYLFIYPSIHSFIHSFIYSLFIKLSIRSFIKSFIHHSFIILHIHWGSLCIP